MFGIMEATRLESLHVAQDPATGLQAIIALHSTRLGPALGGCRYLTYSDSHSAVADAARLAQVQPAMQAAQQRMMAPLTPADRLTFLALLDRLDPTHAAQLTPQLDPQAMTEPTP